MHMNKTLFWILSIVVIAVLAADVVILSMHLAPDAPMNDIVVYVFLGLTFVGASVYTFAYLGSMSTLPDSPGWGALGFGIHCVGLAFYLCTMLLTGTASFGFAVTGIIIIFVGGGIVFFDAYMRYRVHDGKNAVVNGEYVAYRGSETQSPFAFKTH